MYAGIDYETYYDKDCSITHGLQNYLKHENFDAYMVSIYCEDNFAWVGHPKDAPWGRLEGVIALSHNRGFDQPVHEHLIRTGVMPPTHFAFAILTGKVYLLPTCPLTAVTPDP